LASVIFTNPSGEEETLHDLHYVILATEAKTTASTLFKADQEPKSVGEIE